MDGLEIRRKRALYRANHRGTKELDIMLGRYAEGHIANMDEALLAEFEQFLALPDPDIDRMVRGAKAPQGVMKTVLELRAFLGLTD
jgi:antitoxin CptB